MSVMSFDPNTVWGQISLGVKMNLGVREWAYSLHERYVQFRVGAARPNRKIIIRLNDSDLYDVEVGRLAPDYRWVIEATTNDIQAGDLSTTLLRTLDCVNSRKS